MKIDTALLCEAASTHDGLLFVMGGGITDLHRDSFPAPFGLALALRIMAHPTELHSPHKVEVLIQDADGQQVTRVDLNLPPPPSHPGLTPGDEAPILLLWGFPGNPALPHDGRYSLEILIDANHQRSIGFTAHTTDKGEPDDSQQ